MRRLLSLVAALAVGCSGVTPSPPPPVGPVPVLAETPPDLSEPYAYTTPTPPAEPTAIDGEYVRVIGEELAGGAGKCRRCPPYRIEVAASTLRLRSGVFRIENEVISPKAIDWRSVGHYLVEGDEVTLFNDPNCPDARGTYRWSIEEHVLRLDVVDDGCAFGGLRWRYLMRAPWAAASSAG